MEERCVFMEEAISPKTKIDGEEGNNSVLSASDEGGGKPIKRMSIFQEKWLTLYGLEISARDAITNEVVLLKCRFCDFGRDGVDDTERKRKRTTLVKLFKEPWRSDCMRRHMEHQHKHLFEEYSNLTKEEKMNYFYNLSTRLSMSDRIEAIKTEDETDEAKEMAEFLGAGNELSDEERRLQLQRLAERRSDEYKQALRRSEEALKTASGAVTALLHTLSCAGVRFVRFAAVDLSNGIRCKVVPVKQILREKDESKAVLAEVFVAQTCMAGMTRENDGCVYESGFDERQSFLLAPDLSTLKLLPFTGLKDRPSSALLWCDLSNGEDVCCRSLLRSVVKRAQATYGLSFGVGVEIEFCLFHRQATDHFNHFSNRYTQHNQLHPFSQFSQFSQWEPVDCDNFASTSMLNSLDEFITALHQCVQDDMGIDIELLHKESCHGQLEIVLRYNKHNPVAMIDSVYHVKEAIQGVAHRFQLLPIFLPKVFANQAGNGLHLHISVHDTTTASHTNLLTSLNAYSSPNQSILPTVTTDKGPSFLEGILHHSGALMALTLPTTNSFRRIGTEGGWVGGSRSEWGFDDKDCGIRVLGRNNVTDRAGAMDTTSRFEYKLCDSSANLYLALSGILMAGLDGIDNRRTLRPPKPPRWQRQQSEQQAQVTSSPPLPSTLLEALSCLEQSELYPKVLPPRLLQAYLALRRAECSQSHRVSSTLEKELADALTRASGTLNSTVANQLSQI